MIRKALRVLAATVLFVLAAGFAAVLTVKGMQSYVWRTSHRERRLRFDRDLARGERIAPDDLTVDWLPVETPTTVPVWRTECVAERHVLADVSRGDLVQPMLVESAVECLRRERPDDWSRD
ncbi:MAG TPA: hypothetical protein VGK67_22950 [Myxococcales bacterium]|jgi:hypothetical protein